MEEALCAAAAAATVQMQEETDEEVPVASESEAQANTDEEAPTTTEAEAQAETDKDEPALDGETEASGEEDFEWEIVGKPRSPRPIFGKFKECDGGEHAPEASDEQEEEEVGVSQADGIPEQAGATGSATSSTNSVVMDQDGTEDQLSTSTGIDEGEEREEVEVAPVAASTDQTTAEAECVITLLQQDPAIITASLSPTNSLSEPVVVSSPDTEDPQSPASVEKAVPGELPNTSADEIWPALPPIETRDNFIARKPEVQSAEQVAATSSRGILSYAAAAAVPANPSTPIKSACLQGINKATASKHVTLSPNGSPAALLPPIGVESIAQLPLQKPLQEVLIKKTEELSEVPDEPVKSSQATPTKAFVRYAAQRRNAEQAAQEAAAVAAAVKATQASSRDDAGTGSIFAETPQTVSTPKKKRRSGAAQRKARKAKKLAAAGLELSSSRDADVVLTDDSATRAEGLQPSPESVASEAEGETVVSPVTENIEPADNGNTIQEALTDPAPDQSSTPQPLEPANHPEPAPIEEEVPALKPAKKTRKSRTNAQRRAAKERAKQIASEPFVQARVDIDVMCLASVVVAIFACCIVAGAAGWFI